MAKWSLDTAHSEIEFKVRHMMISTVKGQFNSFNVDLDTDSEDLSHAKVGVTIDVDSIDTNNDQRDEHLKSTDFFDIAAHDKIIFISSEIEKVSEDEFKITGNLSIKGIVKVKTFKVELGGVAMDPWGNAKVGYTVSGTINRGDFGLTWNAALETGGVMVSDEVKFTADLQFVKS